MKISKIAIKNYLGVEELEISPSDVNVFVGPNGSGKTSILEAIEATFESTPKRRTEVVKHGEKEATLFIETDNGIEIDRKIRTEKANYLKIKSDSVAVQSTETQLRSMFSGSIFRPLDFIDMKPKLQTDLILSTINIPFSEDKFAEWFGSSKVLSGINVDNHVLMILKQIETNHFATRQDVNREIATLTHQADGIKKELPDNYNGDDWINVSLKDLYNDVSEAEKVNACIDKGNEYKINYDAKIEGINSTFENDTKSIDLKYKELKGDLEDIIDLAEVKIKKANDSIKNADNLIDESNRKLDLELKEKIAELTAEYGNKKEASKKEILDSVEDQKEIVSLNDKKISNKRVEINGLSDKKELELKALTEQKDNAINHEKELFSKWDEYLSKTETIEIEPLKDKATNADNMRSHLREWDRYKDIMEVKVAEKSRYSSELTEVIETARKMPSILLQQYQLPVDGIAVDENGLIRINGTLLDGLSDGEKLDTALRIAHYQMGDLRVMCLDRFEKLDPNNQKKVVDFCESNDIQAFITMPADTETGEVVYSNSL